MRSAAFYCALLCCVFFFSVCKSERKPALMNLFFSGFLSDDSLRRLGAEQPKPFLFRFEDGDTTLDFRDRSDYKEAIINFIPAAPSKEFARRFALSRNLVADTARFVSPDTSSVLFFRNDKYTYEFIIGRIRMEISKRRIE